MPSAAGFTACQTSTYGWPTTSTCGSVTAPTIRLSLEPGTRWSTSTPSRCSRSGRNDAHRAGQVVDAVQRLHHDRLDPQVVTPDPLDQGGVVDALDPDPAAAGDLGADVPDRDRPGCGATGPAGRRGRHRPGQRHRPALQQEAGRPEWEDPPPAVPVLQRHRVLGAVHHRAAEAGAGFLDHQVAVGRHARHDLPPPPVAGEHVGAVRRCSARRRPYGAGPVRRRRRAASLRPGRREEVPGVGDST